MPETEAPATAPEPFGQALRQSLQEIVDQSRALRSGGPAPEDLNELSEALDRATSLADEALAKSIYLNLDDMWQAFGSGCARLLDDGVSRFLDPPDGGDVSPAEQVTRLIEALAHAETEADARGGWILGYGNGEYLAMKKGWPIRVNDPNAALGFLTRKDAESWNGAALDVMPRGFPIDASARTLLAMAAVTFRRYECHHRAKGTEESEVKAEVNAAMASKIEDFINGTGGTTLPFLPPAAVAVSGGPDGSTVVLHYASLTAAQDAQSAIADAMRRA